jgi:hypothetical protein
MLGASVGFDFFLEQGEDFTRGPVAKMRLKGERFEDGWGSRLLMEKASCIHWICWKGAYGNASVA